MKTILDNLIPLILTIVAPAIALLLNKLIGAVLSKWHLDGVLSYEAKVNDLVSQGVLAVEKLSINAINAKLPDMKNEDKVKTVVDFVNKQLADHGLTQKAADDLKMYVESKLMQMNLDGAPQAKV